MTTTQDEQVGILRPGTYRIYGVDVEGWALDMFGDPVFKLPTTTEEKCHSLLTVRGEVTGFYVRGIGAADAERIVVRDGEEVVASIPLRIEGASFIGIAVHDLSVALKLENPDLQKVVDRNLADETFEIGADSLVMITSSGVRIGERLVFTPGGE